MANPFFSEKTKVRAFLSLLLAPGALVILGVIAFPLLFNFILSFSNANIYHIRDWRLIGFGQYLSVFRQQLFWSILFKTVIWTVVNMIFHVSIGVFLAVVLHQKFIQGRSAWRVLLILPWALPQYICALTWRGMFNYEYGAVNLFLTRLSAPLASLLAHFAIPGIRRRHRHQYLVRLSFYDADRARRIAIDSRRTLRGG